MDHSRDLAEIFAILGKDYRQTLAVLDVILRALLRTSPIQGAFDSRCLSLTEKLRLASDLAEGQSSHAVQDPERLREALQYCCEIDGQRSKVLRKFFGGHGREMYCELSRVCDRVTTALIDLEDAVRFAL